MHKRSHVGVELTVSMLPPGRVIHHSGQYKLKSNLQSAYDLGINYQYNFSRKFSVTTGLHAVVGKQNFFLRLNSYDPPIIEDKELWNAIRIPLIAERRFKTKRWGEMGIKAGLNLRYSGFMLDGSIGGYILDPNNQAVQLFNADIPSYKKPWITYLAGVSKLFVLRNYNILSVGLQADISSTYFVKGDYAITFPNQPPSYGTYKINGTSLGLSAHYIFTGANKKMVPRQRESSPVKIKRDNVLSDFVFKGNHLQFTFAPLRTGKAKLKRKTGDHPVGATTTTGLLLSLKYQVNFNNSYSLITGPELIFAGRNLTTSFNKTDFAPPLDRDYHITRWHTYVPDAFLSLPVMIEKRKLYAPRKYLFAVAGLRLNFAMGADGDFFSVYVMRVDSSLYDAAGWEVNANNDLWPWISIPLQVGHGWLLKNNNLLALALCANISFSKYVNGTYYADIPGKPLTTGTYSATGSFIGLALQYNFTNANYRIRKEYQKNK